MECIGGALVFWTQKVCTGGDRWTLCVLDYRWDLLRYLLDLFCCAKSSRRAFMTVIYWVSGLVSVALFVYLTVALLKPEIF